MIDFIKFSGGNNFGFSRSSLCTANILSSLSYFTLYLLIKFLRAIMLGIVSLLNHKYCLYLGTLPLCIITRIYPFLCTEIFFPALVIFSTRYEFQNRSIVEQFPNNINLLWSNLISLLWLCLNKTFSIIFQRFE